MRSTSGKMGKKISTQNKKTDNKHIKYLWFELILDTLLLKIDWKLFKIIKTYGSRAFCILEKPWRIYSFWNSVKIFLVLIAISNNTTEEKTVITKLNRSHEIWYNITKPQVYGLSRFASSVIKI